MQSVNTPDIVEHQLGDQERCIASQRSIVLGGPAMVFMAVCGCDLGSLESYL